MRDEHLAVPEHSIDARFAHHEGSHADNINPAEPVNFKSWGGIIRILFLGTGGVLKNASQQKLYYLSAATARTGYDTHIVAYDLEENRQLHASLKSLAFPHWIRPKSVFEEVSYKHRLIRALRPNFVHIIGVGLKSSVVYGRPSKRPFLIQDYDEWMARLDCLSMAHRVYYRLIEGYSKRRSHGFVVASRALEALIKSSRTNIGEFVLRLPLAYDPSLQAPKDQVISRLRDRLGGRSCLLYLGTIERRYDFWELIDLADMLRIRAVPAAIVMVGGGPAMSLLSGAIKGRSLQDQIYLEGWVKSEEVASYLHAADVLLFPFPPSVQNIYRCPTKVFQYAAANKPIVTNPVGEVQALLGDAGFYYQPRDKEGLLAATIRALGASPSYHRPEISRGTTWSDRANDYLEWLSKSVLPRLADK